MINDIDFALENLEDPSFFEKVVEQAGELRNKIYGKQVFMRGLIELSSYCKKNCLYCGLRNENRKAERYRLSKEQVLLCCSEGYNLGMRTFVLQSGEDPFFKDDLVVEIIEMIKNNFPDVAVTLSIGERKKESYRRLKQAGADRFLLRHETADETLYRKLHPDGSFKTRIEALYNLKELGFQTGAGFMVGLPSQTKAHLKKDLLLLKELQPEMIGIGPFIPHSETPLKDEKRGLLQQTIGMVGLTRLLIPKALIPATTALTVLDSLGQKKALEAGANVIMPNISPLEVRSKYALYEGKNISSKAESYLKGIKEQINPIGLTVEITRGDQVDFI